MLSKIKSDGIHRDLVEDRVLKRIYFTLTQETDI